MYDVEKKNKITGRSLVIQRKIISRVFYCTIGHTLLIFIIIYFIFFFLSENAKKKNVARYPSSNGY